MDTFQLEIITPTGSFAPRSVLSLDVPAETGRLAVLARHQPLVCALTGGAVTVINENGTRENWTVGPGTLTVAGNSAVLLVKSASPPREPAAPPGSPSPGP